MTMRCTGCGCTLSMDELKRNYPRALSCCPERDMQPDDGPSIVDVGDELHQILGEALAANGDRK